MKIILVAADNRPLPQIKLSAGDHIDTSNTD